MKNKEQLNSMIDNIFANMNNIFLDDESKNITTKIEGELDENFFTAELLAFLLQFQILTGEHNIDLIEFIGVLNKLAVQYLLNVNNEKGEEV